MKGFPSLLAATILTLASVSLAAAEPAIQDHPLVSRFAGATVLESSIAEFDEYPLIVGPYRKEKFTKIQTIEGKITHFRYTNPKDRSSLEIARSFQNALQTGGFQILFSCSQLECSERGYNATMYHKWIGDWCLPDNTFCDGAELRYIAAKLTRPAGDVYVAVKVGIWSQTPGTYVNVIEVKPMQAGNVTVNATAMASDIAQAGHTSIYGILFDAGKATLKPESDATLDEISKLLASAPALKLLVVGHTDNVGTAAANVLLSNQRADAVVAALVTRYHVAATRLQAAGVGSLAPVDTNLTEAGRAKNRRVELVQP